MLRPRQLLAPLTLAACGLACAAPVAGARIVSQWHQVRVYSPANVDANTGWLAQQMFDLKKPPARIRVGDTTYAGPWNHATIGRGTMSEALKELSGRYADDSVAIYSDRALTAAERGRFKVSARLYRDADVLVLSAGHPACGGLSLTQARAIAAGRITRWSQVVAGAEGRIAVRYPQRNGAMDLRFGTRLIARRTTRGIRYRPSYGAGARPAADGGVAAAAKGDRSIAAITTWSAIRGRGGTTCVVPLNGVAASNASVAGLRYPGAYPVDVVVRRRIADLYTRKVVAALVDYMRSDKVRKQLRGRGLLVAGDPVPADPPSAPGPPETPPGDPIPVDTPPPGTVPVPPPYEY